jgi:23S rRNA (pseudouridine1915-N3)-methyltransferase
MKLALVCVGRLRSGPEVDLTRDYLDRARKAGAGLGFRAVELIEVEGGGGASAEWTRLRERLPAGGVAVRFDEAGEGLSSRTAATRLSQWRDQGQPTLSLLIGGADGFSAEAREAVVLAWSFGRLTWPHALARVMAAEQLYRWVAILGGSPYHREGPPS